MSLERYWGGLKKEENRRDITEHFDVTVGSVNKDLLVSNLFNDF